MPISQSGVDDGFARVLERFGGGGPGEEAAGEEGQRPEAGAADGDQDANGAEAKSGSDEEGACPKGDRARGWPAWGPATLGRGHGDWAWD